ncbi:hypothetical protein NC653_005230 [Populus alba x Populus x berolinensis]|uniref:Uncharacterized protein n=1 Tax=Populus alba x Populus x berolinensis TaxID=444605 RepID=A0AAD6RBH0_9ROSI|nr:hypothetical protein NC653_005230 [Populus alba x Populus x berolinensis]
MTNHDRHGEKRMGTGLARRSTDGRSESKEKNVYFVPSKKANVENSHEDRIWNVKEDEEAPCYSSFSSTTGRPFGYSGSLHH